MRPQTTVSRTFAIFYGSFAWKMYPATCYLSSQTHSSGSPLAHQTTSFPLHFSACTASVDRTSSKFPDHKPSPEICSLSPLPQDLNCIQPEPLVYPLCFGQRGEHFPLFLSVWFSPCNVFHLAKRQLMCLPQPPRRWFNLKRPTVELQHTLYRYVNMPMFLVQHIAL